jgi:phenylacetate-CoA ligase
LPDDALVQVCDLNSGEPLSPGQTGEVVVTLFRKEYILVRFGVGDLSALMDAPPTNEIPTPRLVGWLGRSGDSVKVRGDFVHPRHADEALRQVAGLVAYQIIVTRHEHRDDLRCLIVPASGAEAEAVAAATGTALQGALKLRCSVQVVESLPENTERFVDERTWE